MLTLELDKQTEVRFNKLLNLNGRNHKALINSFLDYKIAELEKGIRTLKSDMNFYEDKYKLHSAEFLKHYNNGDYIEESHSNDFMIWSSIIETYEEFKVELNELTC